MADERTGTEITNQAEPDAAETAVTEMTGTGGNMSLIAHLEELRRRIIWALAAIAVGSGICWYFIDEIMHYIALPAGKLYYMQPGEAFFTYIKIAIFAGFLLALPVVFYEIWRFSLPALTIRERTVLALVVPSSVLLFFAGLAFSFFLVMPAAIGFFMNFGGVDIQPLLSIDKYFDFVIAFILPFGAIFEVPLVIVIMAKMGLVTSNFLWRKQRIVIFMSFVVGAIISPTPDIFTQSMIAVPLLLLYEAAYLIVRFILRK